MEYKLENMEEKIHLSTKENMDFVKAVFKNATDVVFRDFYAGNRKLGLVYIDGMADKDLLNDFLLKPAMANKDKIDGFETLKNSIISVSDIKDVTKMSDGILSVLSGETLVFVEGLSYAHVIANRSWPNRGIGEPAGETVIRGSREGFTETIRFNTALVRRRIRDTRLKVESKQIGVRSKTDIAIMYIEDIVDPEILGELKERLDNINLDAILDSGYIEQYIEENPFSPFPQIQSTERPDVVAAGLYDGRIGILVDNSPFALIVPAVMATFLQSPDDYYNRWLNGSIVRIIRFLAIMLAIVLPALYVAITSFHTSLIPSKLAYAMARSREGVPFPAYMEALFMEFSLALLIEAITKLPKPVGSTIGIVGGLILGQSAVTAGLASPIMVIVLGITAIATFLIPNYVITYAFSYFRVMIIILAAFLGLYGVVIGVIFLLIHLIRLKSFGIPYLSPGVNLSEKDMKDMYVRLPFSIFKYRPRFMHTQDKIRQKE